MEMALACLAGIVILYVVAKVASLPLKLVWKLVSNSVIGGLMLWVVQLVVPSLEITFLKALFAGILGIPGVVLILIANFL